MAWCPACARYLTPTSMESDGTCPFCKQIVDYRGNIKFEKAAEKGEELDERRPGAVAPEAAARRGGDLPRLPGVPGHRLARRAPLTVSAAPRCASVDFRAPYTRASPWVRGLWRSLVSALDWGSRGPGFESRQPDQVRGHIGPLTAS